MMTDLIVAKENTEEDEAWLFGGNISHIISESIDVIDSESKNDVQITDQSIMINKEKNDTLTLENNSLNDNAPNINNLDNHQSENETKMPPKNNDMTQDSDDEDEDDDVQITIRDIKTNPPNFAAGAGSGLMGGVGPKGQTPFNKSLTQLQGVKFSKMGALDVDEVGKYMDKNIFELNLEELEDKPWRRPGADITDYFNYGFTEDTWKIYCDRQRGLRSENDAFEKLKQLIPPEYRAIYLPGIVNPNISQLTHLPHLQHLSAKPGTGPLLQVDNQRLVQLSPSRPNKTLLPLTSEAIMENSVSANADIPLDTNNNIQNKDSSSIITSTSVIGMKIESEDNTKMGEASSADSKQLTGPPLYQHGVVIPGGVVNLPPGLPPFDPSVPPPGYIPPVSGVSAAGLLPPPLGAPYHPTQVLPPGYPSILPPSYQTIPTLQQPTSHHYINHPSGIPTSEYLPTPLHTASELRTGEKDSRYVHGPYEGSSYRTAHEDRYPYYKKSMYYERTTSSRHHASLKESGGYDRTRHYNRGDYQSSSSSRHNRYEGSHHYRSKGEYVGDQDRDYSDTEASSSRKRRHKDREGSYISNTEMRSPRDEDTMDDVSRRPISAEPKDENQESGKGEPISDFDAATELYSGLPDVNLKSSNQIGGADDSYMSKRSGRREGSHDDRRYHSPHYREHRSKRHRDRSSSYTTKKTKRRSPSEEKRHHHSSRRKRSGSRSKKHKKHSSRKEDYNKSRSRSSSRYTSHKKRRRHRHEDEYERNPPLTSAPEILLPKNEGTKNTAGSDNESNISNHSKSDGAKSGDDRNETGKSPSQ